MPVSPASQSASHGRAATLVSFNVGPDPRLREVRRTRLRLGDDVQLGFDCAVEELGGEADGHAQVCVYVRRRRG